ncbi:MAG: diguanylate cyclase [Gemmatimonadota bacterium]|nr:diguanylate cyclase [Gemmatimonadota bacterium]
MSGFSPNLYLAALGPLTELFGVIIVVAVFALLRGQADRRPYFRAWETSWVFLAVSLTAGLFYERFVDPESVFYPANPATTYLTAVAFMGFRFMAVAMVLNGISLYVRGATKKWLAPAGIGVALVLAIVVDTRQTPLAPLALVLGPVTAIAYGFGAWRIVSLPRTRKGFGSRLTAIGLASLAMLGAALATFYLLQRIAPDVTANPWLVRFARYGFYGELIVQLALAWAMIRLLIEDGHHEVDDARAHMKLLHDRDTLGDLYDNASRLLGRRAFDAQLGLGFARASFGTVALMKIANYQRVAAEQSGGVAEALVANLAGVLNSAVRAHDRVYRWSPDELMIVMPRAVPQVARARVEMLAARAAPLTVAGSREPLRADVAVAVQFYEGGDELTRAAANISRG